MEIIYKKQIGIGDAKSLCCDNSTKIAIIVKE